MVTAFTVAYVSNGYIYYALTYLEKWPAFKCTKVSEKECDIDYYREHMDEPNLIRIDADSVYTLDNWVGRLDLFSKSTFQIGLIGSVYLLGWALGCLFVPRMGDIYGRRWPYLISMGISLLVYLALILSTNINLTTVMFLLLGLTTPAKSNVCYIYLLEFIPKKWQTAVGTALLFGDGSTMIFLSLYFRFISKDWLWFQVFALSLTAAAFLVTLFAPESPKYLYSYKRYKEARKALQVVARFNRVDASQTRKYWFDTEHQEMKRQRSKIPIISSSWNDGEKRETAVGDINKSSSNMMSPSPSRLGAQDQNSTVVEEKIDASIKTLIKDRSMLINVVCLLFLWIASTFDYYLINFQLKYIDGDIYTNTIVSSVSEVTAYLVSGAVYDKIGARVTFIGSYIIGIIGSLFYILFSESN